MAIIFKKVRWQNFLSTGNQFTEIQLNRSKSTLIVGANGAGKCLRKNTNVSVKNKTKEYVTTIGELYNYFFTKTKKEIENIQVLTRNGYKNIEYVDITARNSEIIKVITESGKFVEASPDHRLWVNGEWAHVKDIKSGDTIETVDGPDRVSYKKQLDFKEDLYDLQVEGKEFYANGIVSHNSTMLDAITYALYGKAFRNINKPQLVNAITQKNMLVELDFSVGTKEYTIRRGQKPAVFEIYQSGNLINQNSDIREYQDFLEKNVLKLNFKSFSQIVVLGSANFVPFMQLPAHSRREVIEDMLDIQVFSVMNSILKEKISANKSMITDADYKIELIEQKIELQKKHIDALIDNNEALIRNKEGLIVDIQGKISKSQSDVSNLSDEIDNLSILISDKEKVETKKSKYNDIEKQLKDKMTKLKKEIAFFENNDNCPTCKQEISFVFKTEKVNSKSDLHSQIDNNMLKLKNDISIIEVRLTEISEINNKISELNRKISANNTKIYSWNESIKTLNEEIFSLKNTTKDISEDTSGDLIQYGEELTFIKKQKKELLDQKSIYEISSVLLKDSGIKTKIIKQYIPIMNKFINKYLASMDFMCNFELDESFNEKIKSRFRDEFSYASFSEGEKSRLDLALLFTWRAIAKLRNSASTNILIMDEVFDGSLDSTGADELLNIFDSLGQDVNIFVISHKTDNLYDKFHSVIKFEKHKNFSVIKQEKASNE